MPADSSDQPANQRERLRRHWARICEGLDLTGDTEAVCEELYRRHTEPWRAYHNLAHVEDCLDILRRDTALEEPLDIEAAILFHDAVYAIGAKDSEERSAELARTALTSLGAAPEFVTGVVHLILATDHRRPLHDDRERIICDIDLSILGREPAVYDRYADAIRREVGLPDQELGPHRQAFLRSMLAKDHIFHTARFREKYEAAARTNMQRELQDWGARLRR
ncbi:MAG: metal-dependent phosphohydrolase [Phycisphaerae bacterium]|jgi:predicted metal-dependent HD superfamily phosphohydrolase